jgi:IS1 family transposase/transposase-like protein
VKSDKAVTCPYCRGAKVVRNGIKKNGRQNHLCKDCRKQFQTEYVYRGCVTENRDFVLKMLCRGSGVRDSAAVTGVSPSTVLALIKATAGSMTLKPKRHGYCQVQIDEQWSYVGKKEKKVWMLYAYAVQEDEIIAFTMGKRSAGTVQNLFVKLKALDIDFFLTDEWEAFQTVLPKAKHLIGKQYTKAIEGVNTFFRTRVRRLVRCTVCFSKKLIYHYSMIKILIHHRNKRSSYI